MNSKMKKLLERPQLIERGWTIDLIRKHLVIADIKVKYVTSRIQNLTYLYDPTEVRRIERRKKVKLRLASNRARRSAPHVQSAHVEMPLLDAIREASWAAHRWRDAAAKQYEHRHHGLAGSASRQKKSLYALKEKGIAAAYLRGLLRYAGQSPQGMGVYEYGTGGMSCFHSWLHPAGMERLPVPDHPEVLLVAARAAKHKVADVEHTLSSLPEPGPEFERSEPPNRRPGTMTCYECGCEGHIARHCPERWDSERDVELWTETA